MNINALHAEACGGSEAAQNRLFAHLTESFRLFVRHRLGSMGDVDDVVQGAMTVVVRNYRTTEFTVSFAAWAQRVVRNTMLDHMRARQRHVARTTEYVEGVSDGAGVSSEPMLRMKLVECFRKICRANVRYARALNLTHQGFKADEIGSRLGMSAPAFYVLLSRARTSLAHCLETGKLH